MKQHNISLLFFLSIILLEMICSVSSIAVMSIDFGSEWMKIGVVSPGVPMEIALNKESKRKTLTLISFRDDVRTFGEDGQSIGIRFPKNSYSYILDLLGKDINNPMVKLFQERFPYYEIIEDSERGTVLFKHDENTFYSPEELVAQLLNKAKEFAEQSVGQKIKDCVITVPGFFNQAERRAILQAAHLTNLKVLQLINDYTAVALNYGIFRSKDFNETAQYILFYDMGASKTTATVVSYQTVKTKERGFVESHPQLTVLGVGYDRTLGGLEIQLRLRNYLAKKFNEMKLTTNDVFKNPRAMAKLFKEAGRLKLVLSANTDHYAQVENVLDDQDFRLKVTREELEDMCKDIFPRVGVPITQALNMAGLTLDVINQVVLVGSGTRVPKIQEELQKLVKMELSKNINADEAATMGAVYKAADLSAGFKVKKFITKDGVLFPIQIVFERLSETGAIKLVRRTLFSLMNPYPQKKIITFNKNFDDFKFYVNYADFDHLPPNELSAIGRLNISEIMLFDVAEAFKKHQGENIESKGIKAHFALDESGLLTLINVELVVEKTVLSEESEEEEGTLSKLGNTISKLFQGSDDTPSPTIEETTDSPKIDENTEKFNETSTFKNETNSSSNTTKTDPKDTKPKVVVIKESIRTENKTLILSPMTLEQLDLSKKKISKLNTIDNERVKRETALNNLESFVIDAQNKLYLDEYIESSTDTDVQKIKMACSEISDWLYNEGSDAGAETYENKLSELQTLTRDIYSRVFEHNQRPEALKALKAMLDGSHAFLASAKNLTKENSEKDVFTDVEIQNLEKIIKETIEWQDKLVEEQGKLKKSEPVKLTIQMISEKMEVLDREVKYLVNKLKIWRPKVPKEKPVIETPPAKEESSESTPKSKDNEKADINSEEKTSDKVKENSDQNNVPNNGNSEPLDDHVEL